MKPIMNMATRSGMMVLAAICSLGTLQGCQQARPIEAVRTTGDQKFSGGNYAGARDEYAEIVSRYPGDWQAQYQLGLCMIQTEEYAAARRSLEIAYAAKPQRQDVADALAEAIYRQGDENRLFAFLRERADKTQSVPAYLQLGRYAMELNDPDSAQTALDTAIEIDEGKTTEPYLESAVLADRLGQSDAAMTRLRQAMGINPYDTRVKAMLQKYGEDPSKVAPLPPGREIHPLAQTPS